MANKIYENEYTVLQDLLNNGGDPKLWIYWKDKLYLCKCTKESNKKGVVTYWTNVESEHFASKFINMSNGNAHKTQFVNIQVRGEFRKAVLCEDFTLTKGELKTFKENTLSMETDKNKYDYYFEEILYILENIHSMKFKEVEKEFWEMYIYDAILGNADRHAGNWGIVKRTENNTKIRELSPIFDNGADLLPRTNMKVTYTDTDTGIEIDWWHRRVFEFPTSKIMFKIRERSNYKNVLNAKIIPEKHLNRFRSFNLQEILDKTFDEDFLTTQQKNFYRKFIELRYRCLILNEDFNIVYNNLKYQIPDQQDNTKDTKDDTKDTNKNNLFSFNNKLSW